MSHNTRFKRELLIFYLDKYLQKKNLKMKDFMQNIRFKLLQRNKISLRQFESILEFLKREDAFKAASDQKIINYFRPLITGLTKETETYEPATISEFQLQTDQLQCTALHGCVSNKIRITTMECQRPCRTSTWRSFSTMSSGFSRLPPILSPPLIGIYVSQWVGHFQGAIPGASRK